MDQKQFEYAFAQMLKKSSVSTELFLHAIPIHVEEWTNPATADADGWKTDIASTTGIQTLTVMDGALGGTTLSPPRNVVLVLNNHADWDATTAVVTGTDITGAAMTENISIPNGGNTTVVGSKCFATVTQIVIPAQSGTNGTATLGSGDAIGFTKKVKTRAGACVILTEINANAVVALGTSTFTIAATAAPYGSYTPATTVPDGTRDFSVAYEVDVT